VSDSMTVNKLIRLLHKISEGDYVEDQILAQIRSAADLLSELKEKHDALAAHVERYKKAALDAIPMLSGGDVKANLRDVYDETPQQSLAERDAEIAKKAFKVIMEALEYDDGRYIETLSDRLDMIEEYVAKLREQGNA
jgi:hypothetical protein